MTPIYVKFEKDPEGKCIHLSIHSEHSLHVVEVIHILEGWLTAFKNHRQAEIKAYEDLKKSKKVVSISEWKKQT